MEESCDGMEALKKIQENNYNYIISDIKMPKMSGDILLVNAKKLPHHAKTQFIIITGGIITDYTKDQREIINNQADGYLKKPFSKKMIANLISPQNK